MSPYRRIGAQFLLVYCEVKEEEEVTVVPLVMFVTFLKLETDTVALCQRLSLPSEHVTIAASAYHPTQKYR
ncbi:MAG: hypothetical protein U0074_05560 [Kouleothrix sp.]